MKNLIAIFVAALLFSSCATQYIKNGKSAYENMQYQDAIWYLEKGLAKKDDPDARKMLAESYLLTNDYQKAVETYGASMTGNNNSDYDRLKQGMSLMSVGRYSEAKSIFEGIISRDPGNEVAQGLLSSCKKVNELKSDSLMYSLAPVNIPNFNSAFSAFPYENGLIFSAEKNVGSDKDPYTNNSFTDLYFTTNTGGTWSAAEPLKGVNGKFHDAVGAVSPNGQTIVFTRSFQLNGQQLGGNNENVSMTQLYQSKKNADGSWGKAELLPFCTSQNMFAHPAFSKDGGTLYFASDLAGGFGEMDIYSSQFTDGSWGTPKNVGAEINSKGNELFPSTRGTDTLYFSSDAHKSLGGLDILFSTKKEGGVFSAPVHVSYPINSTGDDFGLIWVDEKSGYLTSNRSGSDKIYQVTAEKPEISIDGLITGKDSMLPLGGVKVTVVNISDGTEKTVFTDGNGQFEATLEPGKDYKIKTDLEGYFSTSEEISTKGVSGDKKMEKVFELGEVYVKPVEENPEVVKDKDVVSDTVKDDKTKKTDGAGTVTITDQPKDKSKSKGDYPVPNIYWDYNKWDIRPDAEPYLDEVAKLFKDNQNLRFQIRSHCDCRGSLEYNDDLSSKRAKAVVDYLVAKGVPRHIITSKGFGERELVNNCTDAVFCTEEKHQENRRTEFIVTEK